jgi:hypothetical protein
MNLPDIINGAFEAAGGLFMLNNVRALIKDKKVNGISLLSSGFFLSWGFWNLYFYPQLNQWVSLAGGALLALANTLWLGLAIYYKYFYEVPPFTFKETTAYECWQESIRGDIPPV